ncbi:glycosyltransferase family 39 protein [Actinomadura sp. PM05-2]|uniref:Glycosyltransferase family 39 protein n=1 Tax=Actinomadura parmotrematis TaxID=2864039 RepID=A0ABS7FPE2_9ACTN|nr:glycosyltransferase family 39 protein [Actinomadura parmotrematis]
MPSWVPRRRVLWLSLLVAAASLAVLWAILPPPLYADPYYVFTAGHLWPHIDLDKEPFLDVPHQVTRMGLVLPVKLAQLLLGDGQAAYTAVAAASGCLFFVGCYLAVRSLFGDAVGLTATALLLVHPFFVSVSPYGHDVTWSTGAVLPDMPGAGLFALGVAGLVVAARRTGRRQLWLLAAAGLCFGSAFLAREFLAFMYIAIPFMMLLLRIPLRRIVVVAGPMLGTLAVNLLHNLAVFGDPLIELRSAAEHGGAPSEPVTRALALGSFFRAMLDWSPLGALFIAALALNIVGWALTRDRRLALTLVWFAALWAPLTLLSGLLDPHDISLRGWLARYWFAVLPALAAGGLGSAVLLARAYGAPLARRLGDRRRPAVAALLAVLAAAYFVPAARTVAEQPRDDAWSELRGWLDGNTRVTDIWADERLGQTMSFYVRSPTGARTWDGTLHTFPQTSPALPAGAADGPLLYTHWRGQEPQSSDGVDPTITPGWRLLWRSSDSVLQLWQRS